MMRTMRGDRTSVRLADPVGALARGRTALKPDGKVLLVEPYAVRTAIGKVLRSRYKVPQHLAHEMIAPVIRADALREGDKNTSWLWPRRGWARPSCSAAAPRAGIGTEKCFGFDTVRNGPRDP